MISIPPLDLPVRKADSGILFQDFPGCDLSRFAWEGVQGVCTSKGRVIEIITIWSMNDGKGKLREFIQLLKKHYDEIAVFGIVEPILEGALGRYNFVNLNTSPLSMRWQSPTCQTQTSPQHSLNL